MKQKIIFQPVSHEASILAKYPVSASSKVPDWFKKIPLYINGEKSLSLDKETTNSTVKSCTPFLDALTFGYQFILNDDVLVTYKDGLPHLNWRTNREMVSSHDSSQHINLPVPTGYSTQIFKWENDIKIKTPKDYSLLCTNPLNRFDLPFQCISGIVDSDKYPLPIRFPFFIKDGWEGVIESGTPIIQLIPIKRDNWKSEIKKI
jgi:hypothetical protein